jgi:regulatory protein
MPHARDLNPPDEASLHAAALAYLARYAASEATLRRVLDRRVERWVRAQGEAVEAGRLAEARGLVRTVVERLAAAGAVDDAAFAAARAHSLSRAGHSRRAVAAHLAAKGVAADTAGAALPASDDAELAAALALVARRRIGPFRSADTVADAALRRRELGVLARAGFARPIAQKALHTEREQAEETLRRLRQG